MLQTINPEALIANQKALLFQEILRYQFEKLANFEDAELSYKKAIEIKPKHLNLNNYFNLV